MEIILSEKYKLRPWKASDASALTHHANNNKIAMNLGDGFPFPYTSDDAKKWINHAMNSDKTVLLAIDHLGSAVGGIGLSPFKDVHRISAEIGYWVSEEYWNKGIATIAVKAMVKYAFDELDLQRIQAGIFDANLPSMNVLKKCGFHLEAIHKKAVFKEDKIMDEHLYVILKEEYLKIKDII